LAKKIAPSTTLPFRASDENSAPVWSRSVNGTSARFGTSTSSSFTAPTTAVGRISTGATTCGGFEHPTTSPRTSHLTPPSHHRRAARARRMIDEP